MIKEHDEASSVPLDGHVTVAAAAAARLILMTTRLKCGFQMTGSRAGGSSGAKELRCLAPREVGHGAGGFWEGLSQRLVHHVTHHHPALNRTWKKKIPEMINESRRLSDGCGNGRVSCQSSPTSQTSKSLFTVTDSQAAPGFYSQTRQPLGLWPGIACVYVCCRDGLGAVALLTVTDIQQLCSDNARCCR